jgi:predicted  nucleic acid-binding Zn-ribbon protein
MLQDQEALLKRLEGQQFQVKSNDAYTALLHEMEHAKQAISDCETRILESMDAIETSRSELTRGAGPRRAREAAR